MPAEPPATVQFQHRPVAQGEELRATDVGYLASSRLVEAAFEDRDLLRDAKYSDAVLETIDLLDRGEVRVAAGALKLWVPLSECRAPGEGTEAARRAPAKRARLAEPVESTVDVRGMRADDAVACVEAFLDRAYGASLDQVTIVHGIGEGALRQAIRALLGRLGTYVRGHRPGTREEGGDRVTVVELR